MSTITDAVLYYQRMNTEVELQFGEWLEDQLAAKKLNQAAFADLVNVAPSTVSAWIKGENPPRRRTARSIAKVLRVPVEVVLVKTGHMAAVPAGLERERATLPDWSYRIGRLSADSQRLLDELIERMELAEDVDSE
jgi:transcriptional regulator with XRE-family HTH domain